MPLIPSSSSKVDPATTHLITCFLRWSMARRIYILFVQAPVAQLYHPLPPLDTDPRPPRSNVDWILPINKQLPLTENAQAVESLGRHRAAISCAGSCRALQGIPDTLSDPAQKFVARRTRNPSLDSGIRRNVDGCSSRGLNRLFGLFIGYHQFRGKRGS